MRGSGEVWEVWEVGEVGEEWWGKEGGREGGRGEKERVRDTTSHCVSGILHKIPSTTSGNNLSHSLYSLNYVYCFSSL